MKQAKLLATFEIAKRHAIAYEITRELAQRTSQASSSLSASSRSNPSLKAVPDDTTKVLTQALQRVSPELRSASREWIGFVPVYRNQVGELCLIDWGTRTHVNTDPAALFQRLLALKPDGFVLFHNHPSRELTPSQADYVLTEEVRSLAEVFKIRLLNHGIVTSLKTRWIL